MELLLDVDLRDGRLEGSVRRPADPDRRTFSGHLELVACLEALCPAGSDEQDGCAR